MDDDGLRNAVRDLVADTHPPTDLLDRALTKATRRRRWLVGLGAAAASAALVGGSFAGAIALERSPSHGGVRPAGDATSTIGLDEVPADLTGKALADAMGLQVVMNCGASMQVAKNPYLTLCLPDSWEWESVEGQEILLQLRGYERTEAMRAFAEQEAIAHQYGLNPDREPGSWAEIAERLEQLRAQLYAEQGEHPENGFENYDPTASPSTD
jgi:hypothetical protein